LAVAKAHPEMMSDCWEWMATSRFKVDVDSDDCMAMDPTNPEARAMVKQLLAEAAETQGLDTKYVHIGGDVSTHIICYGTCGVLPRNSF